MQFPKIIAAFVTGGGIVLHVQKDAETLETFSVGPDDKEWAKAAEAAAHFARSDAPLDGLTD